MAARGRRWSAGSPRNGSHHDAQRRQGEWHNRLQPIHGDLRGGRGRIAEVRPARDDPDGLRWARDGAEQAFVKALGATANGFSTGGSLVLQDASGTELATFKPLESTSLTGVTWLATGINNGKGAVSSVVVETVVTAAFGLDGKLAGKAGCNSYGAAGTRPTATSCLSSSRSARGCTATVRALWSRRAYPTP